MTALIALAAALAPAMSISMISVQELTKLRAYWLLGVLALGSAALLFYEPWLGLMGCWYAIRWRNNGERDNEHPGLITWLAIGGSWFLLRSLPASAWTVIPWAWLGVAGYHVWKCLVIAWTKPSPYARRPLWGLWRTKAAQGSPAITAIFFALVSPFCPWWGWPILLVGLYLTWSWLAFAGVAAGLMVMHPHMTPYLLTSGLIVGLLWFASWRTGKKLFEWTPRGDSFDSVINRLILWWLIVRFWWRPAAGAPQRMLGYGAYSLEKELTRWSHRCWIELPTGEACCDPLQHLYEYGLLGWAAVGLLGGHLLLRGQFGDPWTAAVAAGAVMSFGHYPFRQPAIGVVVLTCMAGVLR